MIEHSIFIITACIITGTALYLRYNLKYQIKKLKEHISKIEAPSTLTQRASFLSLLPLHIGHIELCLYLENSSRHIDLVIYSLPSSKK